VKSSANSLVPQKNQHPDRLQPCIYPDFACFNVSYVSCAVMQIDVVRKCVNMLIKNKMSLYLYILGLVLGLVHDKQRCVGSRHMDVVSHAC
jgi:hypothetical protein